MNKNLVLLLMLCALFSLKSFSQKPDTINLYFDIDKSEITDEHVKILYELLQQKDASDIQIYGFTDFLGNMNYNKLLSEKRCGNIREYLISQGVENKISIWSGRGVHDESSEKNRTDLNDRGIKEHRKVEVIYGRIDTPAEIKKITEKEVEEKPVPVFNNLSEEYLIVGNNIVLDNILFYGGSPEFKPQSMPTLRYLALLMKNNPTLKIEIQGHICCEKGGKDGYDHVYKDYNLSSNRARAVYHYLISKGIEESRMTYKGYGSGNKRFPKEKNEYEQNMNRRVEIVITER